MKKKFLIGTGCLGILAAFAFMVPSIEGVSAAASGWSDCNSTSTNESGYVNIVNVGTYGCRTVMIPF